MIRVGTRLSTSTMKIFPVGYKALLLEFDDQQTVLNFYAEINRRHKEGWCPHLIEAIPAERTILLNGLDEPSTIAQELLSWSPPQYSTIVGPLVEIPTVYNGQDLDQVARLWDMTRHEVVATHISICFYAAFCGFTPGFAYLIGLPTELTIPRRSTSRPIVPAGSVGLAGEYTGIYPRPSPGGWQLIGRTDLLLWDEYKEPPALLAPGMQVRFIDATP